jgi:AcrR family transcriptional regulator
MNSDLNSVKMAQQAPSDLGAKPAQGYHHGDLRAALIDAAKALIAERGVDGFSLRAAARRAGVSAAAPAHHFGDVRGLLTAVATGAFDAFTAALVAGADAGGMDRQDRLRSMGIAYIRFALADPARFDLMWRSALLDLQAADLQRSRAAAFAVLADAIPTRAAPSGSDPGTRDAALVAAWALVHGFVRLALDGAIDADAPGLIEDVVARLAVPEFRSG